MGEGLCDDLTLSCDDGDPREASLTAKDSGSWGDKVEIAARPMNFLVVDRQESRCHSFGLPYSEAGTELRTRTVGG